MKKRKFNYFDRVVLKKRDANVGKTQGVVIGFFKDGTVRVDFEGFIYTVNPKNLVRATK